MNDYFDNYDSTEKNLEYLMHNHGEIYEAYENYGRLVHEKAADLLAEAISKAFEQTGHAFSCMILGSGEKDVESALQGIQNHLT